MSHVASYWIPGNTGEKDILIKLYRGSILLDGEYRNEWAYHVEYTENGQIIPFDSDDTEENITSPRWEIDPDHVLRSLGSFLGACSEYSDWEACSEEHGCSPAFHAMSCTIVEHVMCYILEEFGDED